MRQPPRKRRENLASGDPPRLWRPAGGPPGNPRALERRFFLPAHRVACGAFGRSRVARGRVGPGGSPGLGRRGRRPLHQVPRVIHRTLQNRHAQGMKYPRTLALCAMDFAWRKKGKATPAGREFRGIAGIAFHVLTCRFRADTFPLPPRLSQAWSSNALGRHKYMDYRRFVQKPIWGTYPIFQGMLDDIHSAPPSFVTYARRVPYT